MQKKALEHYIPNSTNLLSLYTVANLAHTISGYAILATFATSPADLADYMTLMGEQADEIQRHIQEFKQTSEKPS